MGFISHHEVERGLIGDRMRAVIMREFSMGDRFGPRCRTISAEDAKVGFYFLIYSFCFAVGLRMVSGREGEVVM